MTSCRRRRVIFFQHISDIFLTGFCSAAWRPPPWRPRTAESECGFRQWRRGTVRPHKHRHENAFGFSLNVPASLSVVLFVVFMSLRHLRSLFLLFLPCVRSEMNGSCVGNVQLSGPVSVQSEGIFLHRFQRTSFASRQVLGSSGLTSGDRIVVSDLEGRLVGLATGYLCEVGRTSISCTLDR